MTNERRFKKFLNCEIDIVMVNLQINNADAKTVRANPDLPGMRPIDQSDTRR